MSGDLDDTRIAAPRTDVPVGGTDHDDTVVRGSLPTAPPAPPVAPPELVEPPPPPARALPPVVEPLLAEAPEPTPPTPPPTAFRVRLANGTVVPVDVPVYLGRKPSAPRIHTGPPPRLVTFPSPLRELSSTHLELRVVGDSLVATDMRSTNGTVVRLPRSTPRTLIRGESTVVVPGTRIDLGEGAVLDVLDVLDAEDTPS